MWSYWQSVVQGNPLVANNFVNLYFAKLKNTSWLGGPSLYPYTSVYVYVQYEGSMLAVDELLWLTAIKNNS